MSSRHDSSAAGPSGTFPLVHARRYGFVASLLGTMLPSASASDDPVLLTACEGSTFKQHLGHSTIAIGDIDGDGASDLVVGSPDDSSFWPVFSHGSVRVVSSATGATLAQLYAPTSSTWYGDSLAPSGDVDADGFVDFLVGAGYNSNSYPQSGSLYSYSGKDGSLRHVVNGEATNERLGIALDGVGDIDLDGFDDYLAASPGSNEFGLGSGKVTVYSGLNSGVLKIIAGKAIDGDFGTSVRSLLDVDGDGRSDIAISTPRHDLNSPDSGMVEIYSGATGGVLQTIFGQGPQQLLGVSLDRADIDGDGLFDVVAGSYGGPLLPGITQAYSSQSGALLLQVEGESSGILAGLSLLGIGDLTGDGIDDLAIGAPYDTLLGYATGRVVLHSGKDGTVIRSYHGGAAGDLFGASIVAPGDVNHDGYPDLAIGIPNWDNASGDAGRVNVYASSPVPVASYGTGCPGAALLTPKLTSQTCVIPGSFLQVDLTNAIGGSVAAILVGGESDDLGLVNGCTILVKATSLGPIMIPLGGSGAGNGETTMFGFIPPTATLGDSFVMQAFVADPFSGAGYSSTAGLRITVQ